MKLRKDKWWMMLKASQIYSPMGWCMMFDHSGVVDNDRLLFSTNLVSLRDMKNIGIEV